MHLLFTCTALSIWGYALAAPQDITPIIPINLPPLLPALVASLHLPNGPPVPQVLGVLAPNIPVQYFNTAKFARPLSLQEALAGVNATVTTITTNLQEVKNLFPDLQLPIPGLRSVRSHTREIDEDLERFEKRQSTCTNPRVRPEWDQYTNSDKQAFVDGIKCLLSRRPSGQFRQAQNRYEDLVVLHQTYTPTVHGNAKFLLWHRYYLWTFEDVLRRECNFTRPLPWFDEAKNAGRFSSSSLFSDQWMGGLLNRGGCVTNGKFAYLAINIGPGGQNVRHCLSRNGDEQKTANTRAALTDACNSRSTFANMAACAEGAAHAWGHNGIGAVMQDTFAAPADPVFWLHHAYIDRNLAIWQDRSPAQRETTISGTDDDGRPLTLDYPIGVSGIRPDVRIRDLLNTENSLLCYRYSY